MKSVVAKPKSAFVNSLRAGAQTIDLARGGEAVTVRVEMADVWDTVRVSASRDEPVASVKRAALDALGLGAEMPEDFVMKLRGWEILNESESLANAEAVEGSTFLLAYRRRRAVR